MSYQPGERARSIGAVLLLVVALLSLGAPFVASHSPVQRFPQLLNAPPTFVHVRGADGRWHLPHIYPWKLANRLEQVYQADRDRAVGLKWLTGGHLVESSDEDHAPFLPLGADSYGRDVFSRILYGARTSLAVSFGAALVAAIAGALVGAFAGYVGGWPDEVLMRASEFVLMLPATYLALALRSAMPLVLGPGPVFLLLLCIFVAVGAPFIAKGVRGIVSAERRLDYVVAATSLGAGHTRVVTRHLLPAARGFVFVQLTLLVPAFVVAEATMSFVGLGFPEPVASWGTMLQEAASLRAFVDFPWLLAPALAMFLVVLAVNLLLQGRSEALADARRFF